MIHSPVQLNLATRTADTSPSADLPEPPWNEAVFTGGTTPRAIVSFHPKRLTLSAGRINCDGATEKSSKDGTVSIDSQLLTELADRRRDWERRPCFQTEIDLWVSCDLLSLVL